MITVLRTELIDVPPSPPTPEEVAIEIENLVKLFPAGYTRKSQSIMVNDDNGEITDLFEVAYDDLIGRKMPDRAAVVYVEEKDGSVKEVQVDKKIVSDLNQNLGAVEEYVRLNLSDFGLDSTSKKLLLFGAVGVGVLVLFLLMRKKNNANT